MTDDDHRDDGETPADGDDEPDRMPEDPFDHLEDAAGDRDGDPFEQFEDPGAGPDPSADPYEPPDDGIPRPEDRTDRAVEDSDGEGPDQADDAYLDPRDVVGPGELRGDDGDAAAKSDGETERSDDGRVPDSPVGEGASDDAATPPTGSHAGPSDASDGPEVRGDPEVSDPTGTRDPAAAGPLGDDPFGDAPAPEGDPFDQPGGVFERVDVDRVDPDQVWEQIAGEGDADASTPQLAAGQSRYAEVSKHSYCEQCRFFSAPPNVGCHNEGTEIVEFVDFETVRLLNCPIVAERRALEEEG